MAALGQTNDGKNKGEANERDVCIVDSRGDRPSALHVMSPSSACRVYRRVSDRDRYTMASHAESDGEHHVQSDASIAAESTMHTVSFVGLAFVLAVVCLTPAAAIYSAEVLARCAKL